MMFSAQTLGTVPGERHDHDGEFSASCETCKDQFLADQESYYLRSGDYTPAEAQAAAVNEWDETVGDAAWT